MLGAFETTARQRPRDVCYTYVGDGGVRTPYSYRCVRLAAAALSLLLSDRGVKRDDCVVLDAPNIAGYPLFLLAAAYGGFTLILLNNRLSLAEKVTRVAEIEGRHGVRISLKIDEGRAESLVRKALDWSQGDASGRSMYPRESEETLVHVAERAGHLFDAKKRAVVMFTSGTTGKQKAVVLSWGNLVGAARASNRTLNKQGEGLWQAALPLCHIGGLQIVVRSFLNKNPFILYRRFDAKTLVDDCVRYGATHVSVVDKMLRDMMDADSRGALSRYHCVLLGGAAANPVTLSRARRVGANVYMSYGMTETSSQIASTLVSVGFDGGLRLLPGYDARIVDPDENGFGRLAVSGPGVCDGYLNARPARTADGMFLTGDTAALRAGKLYVKERTADMFVSGGENVYPEEIRGQLLKIPGVADAYVFGAADPVWGRRPVAFVQRDRSVNDGLSNTAFASAIMGQAAGRLSKINCPRRLFSIERFPTTEVGKTDRLALETYYDRRIEVAEVHLYHVRQPFSKPFETAKETLYARDSIIVEVVDYAGRTGVGECVSFPTPWYLPETLVEDARVIEDVLAPMIVAEAFLHPTEAAFAMEALPAAAAYPMARAAVEPALWDLYGKIVEAPLWRLIGGRSEADAAVVDAGAVVGILSASDTVEAVRACDQAGYHRVKIKVKPGAAVERVRAVREAFPHMKIALDANQSFSECDTAELLKLDEYGIGWIEEPLCPQSSPSDASDELFDRLARLQRQMKTPVCLDESFVTGEDALRALDHPELRCFAVKIAKFGGITQTLEFISRARKAKARVWMGGMYDTGISKSIHAAFQMLPDIVDPGDIGSVTRYYASDIAVPPHIATRGRIALNRADHPYGIGCALDRAALNKTVVSRSVVRA